MSNIYTDKIETESIGMICINYPVAEISRNKLQSNDVGVSVC